METTPMDDDVISFAQDEPETPEHITREAWKVLTVDDDFNYQRSTEFALAGLKVLDRPLQILRAYSYAEASKLLSEHADIAIALVDVVMETDDAGLRLVRAIREVLGNAEIRLVLLTGQPGMAPMLDVMKEYDINDYWTKSELTDTRLQTVMTGCARSYIQIREIARAKRGLQLIAESSDSVYSAKNLQEFSARMLAELAKLLGLPPDGLVCAKAYTTSQPESRESYIIGAGGIYSNCVGKTLMEFEAPKVREHLNQCLQSRKSIHEKEFTCLFFLDPIGAADYAAYIETGHPLDSTEQELIRVFSLNISNGLQNVSLFNRLERLAYEDDTLRIPNRNALLRRLSQILSRTDRNQYQLMLVDIDGFASINTALGARYGDSVLKLVSSRLKDAFNGTVQVSRVKDDLFAVLGGVNEVSVDKLDGLFNGLSASEKSLKLLNISSVIYPLNHPDSSPPEVITRAGIALKQAKKRGIRQHTTYDPETEAAAASRFHLLQALQDALTKQSIYAVLQPQVDLETKQVTGVEVLARWRMEDGTHIRPDQFISLAETTGLILPLGQQILTQGCAACHRLQDAGYRDIRIGVNYSVIQFEQDDMVDTLIRSAEAVGIRPQQIEVEITESTVMHNFSLVRDKLERLREIGVAVAIDDFGTGFSSLAYLSRLAVDRLKIDKSFIDKVTTDQGAAAIAKTIIQLGESFNLDIIAEGVETKEQAQWLLDNGCRSVQGYLYARPMEVDDLLQWLAQRR
ncbi:EAL domain-containing protein [Hahella sp. HN01]|uniref:bifunctional diguanylate cyclase/phosphodiesterase n=1 Tax=Hahella sp. HN01 TaxID=2847262 RepID=UPI001C1EDEE3|nr:EAL domain-containing protein [Hahella sp. HN01]MBU6954889.1 EAL domain-containing protein [Hahella sp. HN01]